MFKTVRKRISLALAGLCTVFLGLCALGPIPDPHSPPTGKPGDWNGRNADIPTGMIVRHTPDFTTAVPRTVEKGKPIPLNNDRGLTSLSPMPSMPKGRSSGKPEDEGDAEGEEGGFLDSWLLPSANQSAEPSGWGWLADSVSDREDNERGGTRLERGGRRAWLQGDGRGLDAGARQPTRTRRVAPLGGTFGIDEPSGAMKGNRIGTGLDRNASGNGWDVSGWR